MAENSTPSTADRAPSPDASSQSGGVVLAVLFVDPTDQPPPSTHPPLGAEHTRRVVDRRVPMADFRNGDPKPAVQRATSSDPIPKVSASSWAPSADRIPKVHYFAEEGR